MRPASSRSGFTLLEVMVSAAISGIVIAAVFAFATHEARLMTLTGDELDTLQGGRSALSTLADDLRHAGGGVGDSASGGFPGLSVGTFTLNGVSFQANDGPITLSSGPALTDDIGMIMAIGGQATITELASGTVEICAGSGIRDGELIMLRSADGLIARSVTVGTMAASGCRGARCLGGCQRFNYTDDPMYTSGPDAQNFDYTSGEVFGELRRVVWFVEASDPSRPGAGALRRAVFDNQRTCTARDASCGVLMTENVESLQMQIWQWDDAAAGWTNVTAGPLAGGRRTRVDIELVIRVRRESDRLHNPVRLRLQPGGCVPASCQPDNVRREVLRTSVEVKNSGRMVVR